jgi:hypothetical protein
MGEEMGMASGDTSDVVSDLERLEKVSHEKRDAFKQRLDEGRAAGRISDAEHEKGKEVAFEHVIEQVLGLGGVLGVVESGVGKVLIKGADFGALLLYFVPLTVAVMLIVSILDRGPNPAVMLLLTAVILFGAAYIQNHVLSGGRHLVVKPVLCPVDTLTSARSCTNSAWYVIAANEIVQVIVAYWKAFGPVAFLACVTAGAGTALWGSAKLRAT